MRRGAPGTIRARIARIPDRAWAPLVAATLILIVGALGLAARQPWIFPSLGPAAYVEAEQPEQEASRFYNVFVGHMIGLGAGFLAVAMMHAGAAPAVLDARQLAAARMWASVLSILLTTLLTMGLRASHPSANATALIVALGGFRTGADALTVLAGAFLLGAAGELFRALRLGQRRGDGGIVRR